MLIKDVPKGRVIETILFGKPSGYKYILDDIYNDINGIKYRVGYCVDSEDKYYLPLNGECRYVE